MTLGGTEQQALAILGDTGSVNVGAQRFGKRVMTRHGMQLAVFLMQLDRPSGAARPRTGVGRAKNAGGTPVGLSLRLQ